MSRRILSAFVVVAMLALGALPVLAQPAPAPAPPPAPAPAPSWVGGGQVEYVMTHKFHEVTGTCDKVEAKAVIDGTGLKLMARAHVNAFHSGNDNRDEHAMEVIEGAKYPMVTVRGVGAGFVVPDGPRQVTIPVQLTIELHGSPVARTVQLTAKFTDATHADISFEFDTSLTGHKIERPSLMFVPVEDALHIRGHLHMEKKP